MKTKKRKLPDLRVMQMTRKVHGSKRRGRLTSNLYFAKLLCALGVVVALGACTNNAVEQTTGDYALEMCGPSPLMPGLSYSFQNVDGYDVVIMTRSTFTALQQFNHEQANWRHCIETLP